MTKSDFPQQSNRFLLIIVGVALIIRLVVSMVLPAERFLGPVRDQPIYLELARNIAAGKGLIGPALEPVNLEALPQVPTRRLIVRDAVQDGYFRGIVPIGQPTAFWEPLYPYVLGCLHLVYSDDLRLVRIVQAILGALLVLPVYAIGLRLYNDARIALIAAALIAVYPFYIYFTGIIMTETLYIFCLYCFLITLLDLFDRQAVTSAMIAGIFAGLTFLTRSVIVGLIPLCTLLLLWWSRNLKRGLGLAFMLLFAFLMTVSGWTIRNYALFHQFIPLPTKGGPTFWARNNPLFLTEEIRATPWTGIEPEQYQDHSLLAFPHFSHESEVERNKQLFKRMFTFLITHPGTYFKLCVLHVRWLLSPFGGPATPLWQTCVSLFSYGLTFLLALIGLRMVRKTANKRVVWVVLLFLIYFILFHACINGDTRFRLPLDCIFILLAAPMYKDILTWSTRKMCSGKKSLS
ncbi:glycosyltransferase family 39 protein [bacterium]|nr:glycosyltransferase family 39 protein [bacterium]